MKTLIVSALIMSTIGVTAVVSAVAGGGETSSPAASPTIPVSTVAPTTTTAAPTKPVPVVQVARTVPKPAPTTTAPTTTTTEATVPAEMPEELKELQKRIPDADEEMKPGDCEWLNGCDDDPSVATDWVE